MISVKLGFDEFKSKHGHVANLGKVEKDYARVNIITDHHIEEHMRFCGFA